MSETQDNIKEIIDSKFFVTMFDPIRFELVKYLSDGKEQSINEIAKKFPQDRSVISRHLEQLHHQNIVMKEKRARYVFYALNCEFITQQFEIASKFLRELMNSHSIGE